MQFNEAGVALVSGFSGQLLKLFMSKPGDMEAWQVTKLEHPCSCTCTVYCSSGELLRLFMSKPGAWDAWKVIKTDHACFSSLHLMCAVLQPV